MSHQKKTLKERADELIQLVNRIKDEIASDPALGDYLEANYPDVIQPSDGQCIVCGSSEYKKVIQTKDGKIYECSDCPEKALQ